MAHKITDMEKSSMPSFLDIELLQGLSFMIEGDVLKRLNTLRAQRHSHEPNGAASPAEAGAHSNAASGNADKVKRRASLPNHFG